MRNLMSRYCEMKLVPNRLAQGIRQTSLLLLYTPNCLATLQYHAVLTEA